MAGKLNGWNNLFHLNPATVVFNTREGLAPYDMNGEGAKRFDV